VKEFNKKNELKLNEYFPYYVDHSLDFERLTENSKIISKLILLGGERIDFNYKKKKMRKFYYQTLFKMKMGI
jgi:hypothetical protein